MRKGQSSNSPMLWWIVFAIIIVGSAALGFATEFSFIRSGTNNLEGTLECGQGFIAKAVSGENAEVIRSYCTTSHLCEDTSLQQDEQADPMGSIGCKKGETCCVVSKQGSAISAQNIQALNERQQMVFGKYYLIRQDGTPELLTDNIQVGFQEPFSIGIKANEDICQIEAWPDGLNKKLVKQVANCKNKADEEGITYLFKGLSIRALLEETTNQYLTEMKDWYAARRSDSSSSIHYFIDAGDQEPLLTVTQYGDYCHSTSETPCSTRRIGEPVTYDDEWNGKCELKTGTPNLCELNLEGTPTTCNPWTSWKDCRGKPKDEWITHELGFEYRCLEIDAEDHACRSQTKAATCPVDDISCRGICDRSSDPYCIGKPNDIWYKNGNEYAYCEGKDPDRMKDQECNWGSGVGKDHIPEGMTWAPEYNLHGI